MNLSIEQNPKTPYRVAHVIRKLGDGGIESFVNNYYNAIDHELIQFDVFYHNDTITQPSEELLMKGMRFYAVPSYQKDLIGYIKALRTYFHDNQYHIVHANMNTISVFSLYAAWRERVPCRIIHNHSVPGRREIARSLIKYFLRPFGTLFATDYFACSSKAARWMYGRKFDKGLVKVIPNAIDFKRYKDVSKSDINALRDRYNLKNKTVIGHVGRFTYAKNHRFLLEIIRELLLRRQDIVLVLVGDGELREEISKAIVDLGLIDRVIQVGWVNNPELYYHLMNVFVFPSEYEGLGMSVIEAQICGVPCVVSKAVPDEAKISNMYTSIDLNEGIDAWVNQVIDYIDTNNSTTNESRNYDIERCAPDLFDYYWNKLLT